MSLLREFFQSVRLKQDRALCIASLFGSWVSYGLGTVNQDLPSFITLPEESYPQGGAANWSNGFLPAAHQNIPLRSKGSPILDLYPPVGTTKEIQ